MIDNLSLPEKPIRVRMASTRLEGSTRRLEMDLEGTEQGTDERNCESIHGGPGGMERTHQNDQAGDDEMEPQ